MAELVLRLRDRELSRTQIRNTRITLGRDHASDVVIDNPSVSRTHAILIYVDEKFRIRDGSANGLTVNGSPAKDAVLNYGDVIGIGKFDVVLQQSAEAVPMQTGSQTKAAAARNVIGTLQMDGAAAARVRDEALAKSAAGRASAVGALEDTVRPPPPKAAVAEPAASAHVATAAVAEGAADHGASGQSSVVVAEAAGSSAAIPPPPALMAAAGAEVATRKVRNRPKPLGVDVIAVLQLAGIGLLVIVGGLGVAFWMLEHGAL